jgi:hypothetical protein
MYLKRYHDVQISQSGVWRILQRVDLSRLPAYQRADRKWKRYEKPRPGHTVQVDVKFIAPLSSSSRKKYYQFTAIDDCTRIRVLRIYRLNQKTAIQFADYLLDKFPGEPNPQLADVKPGMLSPAGRLPPLSGPPGHGGVGVLQPQGTVRAGWRGPQDSAQGAAATIAILPALQRRLSDGWPGAGVGGWG